MHFTELWYHPVFVSRGEAVYRMCRREEGRRKAHTYIEIFKAAPGKNLKSEVISSMSLKHYLSSALNQKKKGNKRRIGKVCRTLAICGLKGKELSYGGRQPAKPACKGAPLICSGWLWAPKWQNSWRGTEDAWQSHGTTWDRFTFPYHHRHLSGMNFSLLCPI